MALGNGTRIALAALAALGLFGAIVLSVPLRGGDGSEGPSGPAGPGEAASAAPTPPPDPEALPEEERSLSFDTVRIEPDGTGIVAGRAEPGTTVRVLAAGEIAAEAEADAQGNFVAFLDLPASDAPRELTLREGDDGPVAAASILIAPTPGTGAPADGADGEARVAEAAPAGGTDGAAAGAAPENAGGEAVVAALDPAAEPPEGGAGTPSALVAEGIAAGAAPGPAPPLDPVGSPVPLAPASPAAEADALPPGATTGDAGGGPTATGAAAGDPAAEDVPPAAAASSADPASGRDGPGDSPPPASPGPDETTPSGAAAPAVAGEAPAADAEALVGGPPASIEPAAAAGAAADPSEVAPPAPVEAEVAIDPAAPVEATAEPASGSARAGAGAEPSPPAPPGQDAGAAPPTALSSVTVPGAPASPEAAARMADPAVSDRAPSVSAEVPDLAAPDADRPGQVPVLLSDAEGVRVLQPALAPGADPEVLRTVALDAISYDDEGGVRLAGRATGGGTVRVYLDNAPVAEAAVGRDGQWSSALGGAAPGIYSLRIDQVSPDGTVVSRIETPFKREERAALAAALTEAQGPGQTIAAWTVQPGHTLWAISRDRYGDGMMYVQVFSMNRDRIRDPDLIYPGQVFVLPATDGR